MSTDPVTKARQLEIDFLRGFMLICMMLNHMVFYPVDSMMFVSRYTYGLLGYTADAEGFIFISGLVAGMAYGSLFEKKGFLAMKTKVYERIGKLYSHQILLTAVILLCGIFFTTPIINWLGPRHYEPVMADLLSRPLESLVLGGVFLVQLPFIDLLPLYAIFLALLPWAIRAIKSGKTAYFLSISVFLWFLGQKLPTHNFVTMLGSYFHIGVNWGFFEPFSWQLLFFSGVVISQHRQHRVIHRLKGYGAFVVAGGGVLFFLGIKHGWWLYPIGESYSFFGMPQFGILRMFNFIFVSLFVYNLMYFLNPLFKIKPIIKLGQHSLSVYSFHVLAVYFIGLFSLRIQQESEMVKILILGLGTVSLGILVWYLENIKPKCIYFTNEMLYKAKHIVAAINSKT